MRIFHRTTRLLCAAFAAVLLSGALTPAATTPDFAELAPAETVYFLQVRNFKQLKEGWPKTAPGRLWNDGEIAAYTAPLRESLGQWADGMLESFFLDRESQKRLFNHQVALYINDLQPLGSSYAFEVCLIAERGGTPLEEYKAFINRMLKDIPERAERNVLKAQGETIYQIKFNERIRMLNKHIVDDKLFKKIPEDLLDQLEEENANLERNIQYCFVDDLFLFCDGSDLTLTHIINRLRDKSKPRLSALDNYRHTFRDFPAQPELRFFMNVDSYTAYLRKKYKVLDRDDESIRRLGLDLIRGAGLAFSFNRPAISDLQLRGRMYCSSVERGLPSLLPLVRRNPLASARLAPAESDLYSCFSVDWPQLLPRALAILTPEQAKQLRASLAGLKTAFNVDLEQDVLGALGGEVAFFGSQFEKEGKNSEENAALIIEIADSEKIRRSVAAVARTFLGGTEATESIKRIQYNGYTIETLNVPEGQAAPMADFPYWVFTDRFLVFGPNLDTLKSAIRVLRGEQPNYASGQTYRQARSLMADEHGLVEVVELRHIETLLNSMLVGAPFNFGNFNLAGILDANKKAPPDVLGRYLNLFCVEGNVTKTGLLLNVTLTGKK